MLRRWRNGEYVRIAGTREALVENVTGRLVLRPVVAAIEVGLALPAQLFAALEGAWCFTHAGKSVEACY